MGCGRTVGRGAVAMAVALAGCYSGLGGATGDGGGDDAEATVGSDGSGEGGSDTGVVAGCEQAQVQTSPVRRLTRWEYNNTVHDLLGDDTAPADGFSPESLQLGFNNGAASTPMSASVVEDHENAALALAAAAVMDLPGLLGCDPAAMGEDVCADAFLADFGRRAFRRPLGADELAAYQQFQRGQADSFGFAKSIEMVLAALLQSPSFLYRVELGMPDPDGGGALRLGPYETATRLAYLLWGTTPDDALLDAAAAGELDSSAQVRAMAESMLADDRGARALEDFHVQWARVASVPVLHKIDTAFTSDVGDAMLTELRMLVDDVVRDGDGTLASLLTTPATYVDAELAAFYGIDAPAGGGFARVELDPTRASGILTQGALMSALAHEAQPSQVYRGKFVLEQLLCAPPPPPPDDVNTSLPTPDPSKTQREQLEELTANEPCKACHQVINPPGFAFDHYDAIGRWRDDDRGLAIDPSGKLTGPGDANGEFSDHIGLAALLAGSATVRGCMVQHWFHYAYGRGEGELDMCTSDQLATAFESSGGDIRGLLLELTQTPAFLYRTDPATEAP
jgi:Protein of unknown function (DUF1592)/Protein of unknown function (DUF1588)/Protein of unknown function (DUF1595)/Protein of unknown function (DUF1587)/Protein of unknown function (DUF1585)